MPIIFRSPTQNDDRTSKMPNDRTPSPNEAVPEISVPPASQQPARPNISTLGAAPYYNNPDSDTDYDTNATISDHSNSPWQESGLPDTAPRHNGIAHQESTNTNFIQDRATHNRVAQNGASQGQLPPMGGFPPPWIPTSQRTTTTPGDTKADELVYSTRLEVPWPDIASNTAAYAWVLDTFRYISNEFLKAARVPERIFDWESHMIKPRSPFGWWLQSLLELKYYENEPDLDILSVRLELGGADANTWWLRWFIHGNGRDHPPTSSSVTTFPRSVFWNHGGTRWLLLVDTGLEPAPFATYVRGQRVSQNAVRRACGCSEALDGPEYFRNVMAHGHEAT